MSKFGRAAIVWTSTEDANTQRIHLLDAPLREMRPGHSMPVYYAESLDRTVQEYKTVGSGAYDLIGVARYDPNAQGLMDMVKAGSQGKTLTYYPNLTDPDVQEDVKLMSPLSPGRIGLDSDRGVDGEHQVTLRFRRTDQKAFPARLRGTDVLFVYHAGDSLADATYSRDTNSTAPATYPTLSSGDNGYGTLTTAGDEKARVGWYSSVSSAGPRMIPGLLIEPSRSNLLKQSNDLGEWTSTAAASSGQADPMGGTNGWLVADASTSAFTSPGSTSITFTAATNAVVSGWVKDYDGSTLRHDIRLRRSTDSVVVAAAQVTFSSGIPSVTYTGIESNPPERWRNGWYRVAARTTAVVSTVFAYQYTISPAATAAGDTGTVYWYGGQGEV